MSTVKKREPRTYRIVGPQRRIDERETPHPRAARGELGERVLKWRKDRAGVDAFGRVFGRGGNGDPNNSFQDVMSQVPEGAVNPDRLPVSDPVSEAHKIKEVARFFGADAVGITHLDQAYIYSHRARSTADGGKAGDPIDLPHRFAICLLFAGDYDRYMTCNSRIADAEYQVGQKGTITPTFMLAAYIREMGYAARAHCHSGYEVNPIPLAVNAGLGELGRYGMLIHEEYGSRVHLATVTTDLPLAVDAPVDIGVEDFCRQCMKCARNCPSYSISFGDKVVINGVEKWAIDVDSCYKARLAGRRGQWANCLICVTVCPYNKRSAWWHTLAVWMLKKTPIPLRTVCIKPLLWIDDLIWGKKPWRHMKWLDYDNAPVPVTCNVRGCTVEHKSLQHKRLHDHRPRMRVT